MSNAAAFSGNIPAHYENGLGPVLFVDYADETARRVAAFKPRAVLETAAGTGFVTRRLRDLLPDGTELTATDLNAAMLELAKPKFRSDEKVTLQPADAQNLSFDDAGFDAMVCQFGIMFYPDKARGYAEAFRVLRPGGRYFFSVWDSHAKNPFGRIGNELAARFCPVDPPRFYQVPFSCHAIDPVRDALAEAGFGDVTVNVMPRRKRVADLGALARGMIYGNPMIDEVKSRGVDPEAMVAASIDALRAELDGDGRVPLQAILYEAVKP